MPLRAAGHPRGAGMTDRLKVLFVCSRNQWRSPTAESIFRRSRIIDARSAGTSSSARRRVSTKDLEWADIVFVMGVEHRDKLREMFGRLARSVRIEVLGIPDEYQLMDPELIEEIRTRVGQVLPETLEEWRGDVSAVKRAERALKAVS